MFNLTKQEVNRPIRESLCADLQGRVREFCPHPPPPPPIENSKFIEFSQTVYQKLASPPPPPTSLQTQLSLGISTGKKFWISAWSHICAYKSHSTAFCARFHILKFLDTLRKQKQKGIQIIITEKKTQFYSDNGCLITCALICMVNLPLVYL